MMTSDTQLRIVGFTDEQGTSQHNSPVSQDRANVVMQELIRRGVPANRMVPVGRHDLKGISSVIGASSPNRRVEFELGFVGEASE